MEYQLIKINEGTNILLDHMLANGWELYGFPVRKFGVLYQPIVRKG